MARPRRFLLILVLCDYRTALDMGLWRLLASLPLLKDKVQDLTRLSRFLHIETKHDVVSNLEFSLAISSNLDVRLGPPTLVSSQTIEQSWL